jgi:lytic murein transglycosylase
MPTIISSASSRFREFGFGKRLSNRLAGAINAMANGRMKKLRPIRRALALVLLLLIAALHGGAAQAQPANAAAIERQFRQWLEGEIRPAAAKLGVSAETFDAALGNVSINWKLPDLVPPGTKPQTPKKQLQAEFRAPAAYFAEKSMGAVVTGGRSRLASNKAVLSALEKRYGVPGRFLLAIWGRESGFGSAKIPHNAFEVLATKAFMSTRRDMFTEELLAALVMAERHQVPLERMRSSWAGALGQPQFLPSSYLKYAADGDGDGKSDIWRSDADTLASMANYLAKSGWVAGRDWGFEVTVPESVSCSLEGPDRGRRIAEWASMGIARVGGKAFPGSELQREGFLLMPAGRFGPAFIVTPNFYVLKEYNESDLYALFIGNGADRIQFGAGPFAAGWAGIDPMYRSEIADMQRQLEGLGYDVGGADGLPGFKTRRSIGEWQQKNGAGADCFPSKAVMAAMGR